MSLLRPDERRFALAISALAYCNPFLPERIKHECEALGPDFREADSVWNVYPDREHLKTNVEPLLARSEAMAARLRQRLVEGVRPVAQELELYEDLVLLVLYHRYHEEFDQVIDEAMERGRPPALDPDTPGGEAAVRSGRGGRRRVECFNRFLRDAEAILAVGPSPLSGREELAHVFACFFQIRRAFHHIFRNIIGISAPAVGLRAAVWQSIFTHDMHRYRRTLYNRMGDITTLITGPSGTGKELVARAIGHARYIPFDPRSLCFTEDFAGSFQALNLSALSPTLIESELFGHRRGSFTGAIADRAGYLEVCPPLGTVFLDEIGDLDGAIQVKLLRVLQSRTFARIGEGQERRFRGKIIAATNRDLAQQMSGGCFREDFYYRLCSDLIRVPSLAERLRDSWDELPQLLLFITRRLAGLEEAQPLAEEVATWIKANLGRDYAWPGNVRELEQCVRNVMIRKSYQPAQAAGGGAGNPRLRLEQAVGAGALTAEELLRRYCTLVYAQTGNYQETARRLGLDRRTVKERVDVGLLEEFRGN